MGWPSRGRRGDVLVRTVTPAADVADATRARETPHSHPCCLKTGRPPCCLTPVQPHHRAGLIVPSTVVGRARQRPRRLRAPRTRASRAGSPPGGSRASTPRRSRLRVRRLPQQEAPEPLLARGADHQVRVGLPLGVQVRGDVLDVELLGHLVEVQSLLGRLPQVRAHRVGDLVPLSVPAATLTCSPTTSLVASCAARSACAVLAGSISSEPTACRRQRRVAASSRTTSSMMPSRSLSSSAVRLRLSVESIQSVTTSTPTSSLQARSSPILSCSGAVPARGGRAGRPRPATVAVEDHADVAGHPVRGERGCQSALVEAVERVGQSHSTFLQGSGGLVVGPVHRTRRGGQGGVDSDHLERLGTGRQRYLRCRNLRLRKLRPRTRGSMTSTPASSGPGPQGGTLPSSSTAGPLREEIAITVTRAVDHVATTVKPLLRGWIHAGRLPVRARGSGRARRPVPHSRGPLVQRGVRAVRRDAVRHERDLPPRHLVAAHHRRAAPARPHEHLPHHRRQLHPAGGPAAAREHRAHAADHRVVRRARRTCWRASSGSAPRGGSTCPIYLALGWVAVAFLPQSPAGRARGHVARDRRRPGCTPRARSSTASRSPNPSPRYFGFHEIFHALTVAAFIVPLHRGLDPDVRTALSGGLTQAGARSQPRGTTA